MNSSYSTQIGAEFCKGEQVIENVFRGSYADLAQDIDMARIAVANGIDPEQAAKEYGLNEGDKHITARRYDAISACLATISAGNCPYYKADKF